MSEQSAEAATEAKAAEQPTADTAKAQEVDYKAEAEKWQALARKHEERAKANADKAKGYDDLKRSQETEQEKAVREARDAARGEVLRETAPRLVGAEFRAALAGRRTAAEVAELIEDLDLSKYLTEAGEVDAERVAHKAELLAPKEEERKPAPTFGGGVRKTDAPEPPPGVGRLSAAYAKRSSTK